MVMARILYVEDDEAVRTVVVEHLTETGHEVATYADTMQALNEIDRRDARIDLLLLDVVMPPGQPNGITLAWMFRVKRPSIPVIFLTGHAHLHREIEHVGRIMTKPVDFDVLTAAIADELRRGRARH
jgi:DNA-binding NtrC family response regulator